MRERKRQRMEGYKYATPGAYFVTICVLGMREVFGDICCENKGNGSDSNPLLPKMKLNESGEIARNCWLDLPNHYANCRLDEFVIMPNHVHGIVWVVDDIGVVGNGFVDVGNGFFDVGNGFSVGNALKPFPTETSTATTTTSTSPGIDGAKRHGLPEMMRGFKTFSSRRINERNPMNRFQWQKSYHDRIVRNEDELNRIRKYIIDNPANWIKDRNNNITHLDTEVYQC